MGKKRKRRPGKGREGKGGVGRKKEGGGKRKGRAAERWAGRGGALGGAASSFGEGLQRGGRRGGAAGTRASAQLRGVGSLCAARPGSEGHVRAALSARPGLLAPQGLPVRAAPHLAAAPQPGSGASVRRAGGRARGPPQSWGCSPWSSATATSTARGSGRGSAPTKRSSRRPTSSSKSSSRTGRTSLRRPRVSRDLGAGVLRRGRAGRSLSWTETDCPVPRASCRRNSLEVHCGRWRPRFSPPGPPDRRSRIPFPAPTPLRPGAVQGGAARGSDNPSRVPSLPAFPAAPPEGRFYYTLKLLIAPYQAETLVLLVLSRDLSKLPWEFFENVGIESSQTVLSRILH